jgi:DNA-binding transcriptional regulator YdaS (Cro superfamily)
MIEIPATERKRISDIVGLGEQYLYQCFTMRRVCPPEHCAAIELASDGVIRRWHLRPQDWYLIWPELVGIDGAPGVPQTV